MVTQCNSDAMEGFTIHNRPAPLAHLYLPPDDKPIPDDIADSDAREKYTLVKAFEKALRKPWFMAKKIKERDCPVYDRWCSVMESKNVDSFLTNYVCKMKEDDPSVNPFDMLDEISIVFPTVETIDMFQMINNRKSFKSDDIQWTGHSDIYSKVWAEMEVKPS